VGLSKRLAPISPISRFQRCILRGEIAKYWTHAEIMGKAETLKGHSGFFKARVGDYRVGFEGQARAKAAASPPPAA